MCVILARSGGRRFALSPWRPGNGIKSLARTRSRLTSEASLENLSGPNDSELDYVNLRMHLNP